MKVAIAFLLILSTGSIFGQQSSSFDQSLQQLTDVLGSKLQAHKQQKIAVWDLSELNGSVSLIGKYVAEDISINLSDKFQVVNRNQLQTVLKENKLKAEGFIDQVTMKQIKKLSDIEIIITGTISVLQDHIKITLQALDQDANIIAATKGEVPMNADIEELLGVNTSSSNRGFNRPLNSNEQLNNPETVNEDCQKNSTGDYCFLNATKHNIRIDLKNTISGFASITVSVGQTECILGKKSGVWQYSLYNDNIPWAAPGSGAFQLIGNGEIRIEKCASKTLTVK